MAAFYNWTISWAHHSFAKAALFGISFIEASFFPVPPDVLLILMTALLPKDWFKNAALATLGSVLGGLFGYFIGFFFYEKAGAAIISFYGFENLFSQIGKSFNQYSFWAIFAAGLTFIPFKVFTISAGVFGVPLFPFILASFLSRGLRFFTVSFILHLAGIKAQNFIERYFNVLTGAFVFLLIFGFFIIKWFL